MKPNKLDWLIYRLFSYRWNKILNNNPVLAIMLVEYSANYVKFKFYPVEIEFTDTKEIMVVKYPGNIPTDRKFIIKKYGNVE